MVDGLCLVFLQCWAVNRKSVYLWPHHPFYSVQKFFSLLINSFELTSCCLCLFWKTYSPKHINWRHEQDWKKREKSCWLHFWLRASQRWATIYHYYSQIHLQETETAGGHGLNIHMHVKQRLKPKVECQQRDKRVKVTSDKVKREESEEVKV